MNLTLISSRSGCGKTNYIYENIKKSYRQGKKCLLIVPEQATHQTEQKLVEYLGGGLFNAEVISFGRLIQRVFEQKGGQNRVFLNEQGKLMVLRKLIEKNKNSLQIYSQMASRSGFAKKSQEIITTFKNSGISPQILQEKLPQISDQILSKKINDINKIYEAMEKYIEKGFVDEAQMYNLFFERAGESELIKDTEIFIDGFNAFEFNHIMYLSIGVMIRNANSLTMSFCFGEQTDDDFAIFASEKASYEKILEIGKVNKNIEIREIKLKQTTQKKLAGVDYLEKNLFCFKKAKQIQSEVRLYEAIDPKQEVSQAANQIAKIVKKGGTFGDITIVAAEMEIYAPLVRRIFSQRKIPNFIDGARNLCSYNAVQYVIASVEAALSKNTVDCLRVAKTGFSPLNFSQTQTLENYVIKFGVKYSGFFKEFTRSDERDDVEFLENAQSARNIIAQEITQLAKDLKNSKDAKELAQSVYKYLSKTKLQQRIEKICIDLQLENKFDVSLQNAQVWNAIVDVLKQVALLVQGEMKVQDFAKILEEGFCAREIDVIPPTNNQVEVCRVQKAVTRDVKNMIFLGFNDGNVPRVPQEHGIINDAEAKILQQIGVQSFLQSSEYAIFEKQLIYKCLARAKESLFISFSKSTCAGKKLEPSNLVFKIRNMFSNVDFFPEEKLQEIITSKDQAISELSLALRRKNDGEEINEEFEALFAYFSNQSRSETFEKVVDSLKSAPSGFDPKQAKALFDPKTISSVTRIETFNKCPYKHFIDYGIVPKKMKEFGEQRIDQGNFYHEAFNIFTKTVIEQNLKWSEIEGEKSENMLDEIIDNLEAKHNFASLKSAPKFEQMAEFMRSTAKKTVCAMVKQINAGDFKPKYSEASVGKEIKGFSIFLENGGEIVLQGKIDRVDVFENGEKSYVRIIDYKSSKQKIDYSKIYNGIGLQLPIYMHCVKSIGDFGGMYYMQIQNPVFKIDETQTQLSRFKLEGVMLDSLDVAAATSKPGEQAISNFKFGKDELLSGDVLTKQQSEALVEFAIKKANQSAQKIFDGQTQATPAQIGQQKTCEYCDYQAICRFEPQRFSVFNVIEKMSKEEFFDKIEKEDK